MTATSQTSARTPSPPTAITRRVIAHVTRRFPEMRGVVPSTSNGQSAGQMIYTFRTQVELDTGRMTCIVRVIVDEQGRIVRTISSH
ncbi:MAG: hypothetical protein KIS91_10870 [Anaerolineae bacterium]|nr:hypothetical protein [Anaerolineae bacterium]